MEDADEAALEEDAVSFLEANLTQETGESSDIEGQSITLLTEDLLKLRQAEVQGRSLLKKSFQQSFEAGKKRQEALRKQAKIAKVQKALDQMQQNLRTELTQWAHAMDIHEASWVRACPPDGVGLMALQILILDFGWLASSQSLKAIPSVLKKRGSSQRGRWPVAPVDSETIDVISYVAMCPAG
eukprot:Skav227959  [mRNA]  locus=scaffold146:726643:730650:- [translate_table: standard]